MRKVSEILELVFAGALDSDEPEICKLEQEELDVWHDLLRCIKNEEEYDGVADFHPLTFLIKATQQKG